MASLRRARRLVATVSAAAAALAMLGLFNPMPAQADPLPSPPPVQDTSADVVSADALPTVQIDNGVVWNQVVIGTTVYAAGNFSQTRPAGAAKGTNLTPRSNVLAYNITTGDLIPGFAPQVNGQVRTIARSPDGSRIYIGGDFTQVNGTYKWRVAALDPTTGALISSFNAVIGGSYVTSIAATNSTVYIGGLFTAASGAPRANLAAYSASGSLLNWTPGTDLQIDSMVMAPGDAKVIIAGRFGQVNGITQRGMAALDPSTGTLDSWPVANTIKNGASSGTYRGKAGIYSLSTDGTSVFGTGWVYATADVGNLEGTFSATPAGDLNWIEACHGDTYSAYSDGTTVYTVSHAHYCGDVGGFPQSNPESLYQRHALAFTADVKGTLAHDEYAGSTYYDWYGYPAPSMVDWFPDLAWGSFTSQSQAAWTVVGGGGYISLGGEFPTVNGAAQYGLTRFATRSHVTNPSQGPRLSGANWPTTVNTQAPGLARVSVSANWDRDNMALTYKLIRDGDSAHPVDQKTVDSTFWNTPTVSLTDPSASPGSHTYRVIATDPDGNTAVSANTAATVTGGSLAAYPKMILADGTSLYWRLGELSGSTAADLSGNNNGVVRSGVTLGEPGAIAGDSDTSASFNGTSSGLISASNSLTGPNTFSVTAWFKTTTKRGGKIFGFGGSSNGLSSNYDRHVYMDNSGHLIFGVYPGAVATVQTTQTYNDGDWHQVVASLGQDGMTLYVDGAQVAQRSDITSAQAYNGYWRVGGDSVSGWPSQPSSSYFAGDIDEFAVFPSVLSSSDVAALYNLGSGTGVVNEPPAASFTTQVSGLGLSVDGSGSTDSDGSIASYDWDWGDSSADGSGSTATHTYASAGTYTVKLTVTDNDGATDSTTHQVTVQSSQSQAIASDSFSRNLATGWGSADVGGSWTVAGSASLYAVGGGVGMMTMQHAAQGPSAELKNVSATDVDLSGTVSLSAIPDGNGATAYFIIRKTSAGDERLKVSWMSDGSVRAQLATASGSTETVLVSSMLTGVTGADTLKVRFEAITEGSGTTLSAKVWKASAAEPATWDLTSSDTNVNAQGPGSVMLRTYLSGTSTNFPITASFGDLNVVAAGD